MSSPERLQQNFKEEWRPITEYVGLYEVSSFGNVRSLDRKVSYIQRNQYGESNSFKHLKGKLLAKRPTVAGYLRVQLSGKDFYIHRLVAQEERGVVVRRNPIRRIAALRKVRCARSGTYLRETKGALNIGHGGVLLFGSFPKLVARASTWSRGY